MKKFSMLFLLFVFAPLAAVQTVETNPVPAGEDSDCPSGGIEIVTGNDAASEKAISAALHLHRPFPIRLAAR